MAWQLKKKQEESSINKLNVNGKIIDNPKEIRNQFVSYYTELYRGKQGDVTMMEEYLKDSKLPKISSRSF